MAWHRGGKAAFDAVTSLQRMPAAAGGSEGCWSEQAILCVVVTAAAAVLQMIKDQMDKKFGSPWHVIVGRAFAYEITYEVRTQDRQQLGVGIVPAGMQTVTTKPVLLRQPTAPPSLTCCLCVVCVCVTAVCLMQLRNILYLYVGGTTGVLLWKM